MQAEFQFFEKLLLRMLKSETVSEHSVCKSVIQTILTSSCRATTLVTKIVCTSDNLKCKGNPPGLQAEAFYWNSSSVLTISVSGIDSLFGIISPIS